MRNIFYIAIGLLLVSCAGQVVTNFYTDTSPTYAGAKAWRKQAGYVQIREGRWEAPEKITALGERKNLPALINGNPVDRNEYPEVLWIRGTGGCTASLVGPSVVLTAAHCVDDGGNITFKWKNVNYSASCNHHPEYRSADHDMALCRTNKQPPIKPVSVVSEHSARKNQKVRLLGFGCVNPGGGGGNDGILRTGFSKIIAGQGRDLVLAEEGGSTLCFGDSGGPVYTTDGKQLAVNSKGNIRDRAWVSRTDKWAKDWMTSWAKERSVEICGVTSECSKGDPPNGGGGDKKFSFDNDQIHIEGHLK